MTLNSKYYITYVLFTLRYFVWVLYATCLCVCWCGAETAVCLDETSVLARAIFVLLMKSAQHLLTSCNNYFYLTKKKSRILSAILTFPCTTYKIGTLFTNFVITNILFTLYDTTLLQRLVHTHKRI